VPSAHAQLVPDGAAHTTDALARNFYEAMAMAEHFGFRQGRQPEDIWTR
jgi:histidinol-phosphatase (PHP family)